MADNKDCKMEMEEKKIPVFSVLKNGSILKNIFLLNNPPSISEPSPIGPDANREKNNQENDEILLVGRHPDCNIMLEHPSVSRFHLRIHSQPSLKKLSVVDLSSAHGTWVSGKKIEPQVLVELNEGDTLRLGASTRIYKLHWLPLIRAFDMMNPFVPPSALAPLDVIEEEISQDNGSMSFVNKQILSEPPVLETLNSSFPDENSVPVVNQCIPLEPPTLEVLSSLFHDENSISVNKQAPLEPPVLDSLNSLFLDEISAPFIENQAPSAPPMPEFMNSSCPEEVQFVGEMLEGENQSPTRKPLQQDSLSFWSEPRVTESVNSSLPVDVVLSETLEEQFDKENQSPQVLCVREVLADTENKEIPLEKSEKKCPSIWSRRGKPSSALQEEVQSVGEMLEGESQSPTRKPLQQDSLSFWSEPRVTESVNSSLPVDVVLSEISEEQFDKENQSSQVLCVREVLADTENKEIPLEKSEKKCPSIWSRRGKPSSALQEEVQSVGEMLEGERQSPTRKPLQQDNLSFWSEPRVTESVNSSLPVDVVLSETSEEQFDKENQSSQVICVREVLADTENKEIPLEKSEKKCPSIWSRRGKPSSALQIQTGRNIRKTVLSCTGDGIEPENQNENKNASPSTAFFSGLDGEEEIFTPDKENLTPNTLALKAMKKGRLEEIRHPKLSESLLEKITSSSKIDGKEDTLFSSDKENITPKVLSGRLASGNRAKLANIMKIKRKEERAPFQCLLANSSSKSLTEDTVLNAATRSSNSVNCSHSMWKKINPSPKDQPLGDAKKRWYMVVDTTSLLNKESRKSLQLLQGLKGTQLIIPRMVIRELDCMKRRGSLFRRATEVSSVLEWIEDCMVKTKWWIHVQNSVEGMPIAPTPPASPGSQLSEGSNGGSVPFSSFGSLMEIVSPTAEDHILDCALLFKRIKNDGQLVLLTNDVTLKIKAMAEGLICETAEEFRESLVNPYSERFLWVDSTPRGPTWSCSDDVVLKEKYYRFPMKKTSKPAESARGLKLILFHNSHYGQIDSVN
uniref:FHA domain-containing protein n=1 Tax=Nelumbo nucifera TaxID=4432 RepID=A0A822Z3R4_NELNU|nr:TPA_asm: hypothetical protein HUJ06_013603 [Nelumbo nucifera]